MSVGMRVRIRPDAVRFYRSPAAPAAGVIVSVSPLGSVARVHMDELGDSYIRTDDLEIVY